MRLFIFLVGLAVVSAVGASYFDLAQEIYVVGRVFCNYSYPTTNGSPHTAAAPGAIVVLSEQDMLFDDVLSQTTTDTEGKYSLGGKNVELNWITPLITAKHACDLSITMEDGDRFPSPLGKRCMFMQTRVLEQTKAVEFLSVEVLIDTSTADIVCE